MQRVYDDRFKGAPWYGMARDEQILLVGTGGIGSNALYNMARTIPAKYFIVDHDIVVAHNVGCQFFKAGQVDMYKVGALSDTLKEFGCENVTAFRREYRKDYTPIVVTGLHDMKTRKEVFEVWRKREDRELFIDGRMRATLYQIYTVRPGMEDRYEKTLFDDKEVDEGECTFRQTSNFGMLIGARITQILTNYLTNKYLGDEICTVPFHIKEIGEPMSVTIES